VSITAGDNKGHKEIELQTNPYKGKCLGVFKNASSSNPAP